MRRPLRVSFDLDDTLIIYGDDRPCDPCLIPILLRPFFRDPLRQGSRKLLHELHERGVEIWVYTTSRRSELAIRLWWRLNQLPRLNGVINELRHKREMQQLGLTHPPTKLPGHWEIDIHVDDLEGVRLEQPPNHPVHILVVDPMDKDWGARAIEVVDLELRVRAIR